MAQLEAVGSLHGVNLLVSPNHEPWAGTLGSPRGVLSPESEAEKAALDAATIAGASILRASFRDTTTWSTLDQPDTYSFGGRWQHIEQLKQKSLNSADAPKTPWTKRLTESTDINKDILDELPLVLASDAQGGDGKYLLERPEQVRTAQKYVRESGSDPAEGIELFELREFIPTPSRHFTSYRVLTTPTGEALAAGLLYSGHTDAAGRRVGDVPSRLDQYRSLSANPLENPYSPHYLGAADIRSNMQQGGSSIPLMGGDRARPISAYEAGILEAHGIDPDQPSVPPELLRHAAYIGRTIGKGAGLVAGLDFLQHRDTGDLYFLEANITPGTQTYANCHYGSRPDISSSQLRREMLFKSLASISRMHS